MPEEEVDPKPKSDPTPADEASEQARSASKEAKQSDSAEEPAKEAKKPAAKDADEEPDGQAADKKPTAKDKDTDTEKKSDSKTADKKSTAKDTEEKSDDKASEKKSDSKADKKSDSKTADKKKKKDKPPPVEEKPFADFIQQDYMPALKAAFAEKQLEDLELTFDGNQVKGDWSQGNKEFIVYFPKEDIKETKAFSVAMAGRQPSTIEPFLIDERRINLDLLVFGVIQRLNGQKWFGDN